MFIQCSDLHVVSGSCRGSAPSPPWPAPTHTTRTWPPFVTGTSSVLVTVEAGLLSMYLSPVQVEAGLLSIYLFPVKVEAGLLSIYLSPVQVEAGPVHRCNWQQVSLQVSRLWWGGELL